MKIQQAYKTFEDLLAKTEKRSEKKVYQQLLAVLHDLKERELSLEQLQLIEEAITPLLIPTRNSKELNRSNRRFISFVSKTLILIPEGHYTALGLAMGVALGASIAAIFQGLTGMPQGNSGTGLGVGIGLIIGCIIGSYLDVDAAKKNRVLKTSLS
jgi:hypothetical protein